MNYYVIIGEIAHEYRSADMAWNVFNDSRNCGDTVVLISNGVEIASNR